MIGDYGISYGYTTRYYTVFMEILPYLWESLSTSNCQISGGGTGGVACFRRLDSAGIQKLVQSRIDKWRWIKWIKTYIFGMNIHIGSQKQGTRVLTHNQINIDDLWELPSWTCSWRPVAIVGLPAGTGDFERLAASRHKWHNGHVWNMGIPAIQPNSQRYESFHLWALHSSQMPWWSKSRVNHSPS